MKLGLVDRSLIVGMYEYNHSSTSCRPCASCTTNVHRYCNKSVSTCPCCPTNRFFFFLSQFYLIFIEDWRQSHVHVEWHNWRGNYVDMFWRWQCLSSWNHPRLPAKILYGTTCILNQAPAHVWGIGTGVVKTFKTQYRWWRTRLYKSCITVKHQVVAYRQF